jgi:hypothetical protein
LVKLCISDLRSCTLASHGHQIDHLSYNLKHWISVPTSHLVCGIALQLPMDQLVLLVTLLSMAIVCLSVWWGVMRPPAVVLKACSRITKCFTFSCSKPASQPDADANTADSDVANATAAAGVAAAAELPNIDDKPASPTKSPAKRPGSPSKVDSAEDLHNTSLRCMAVSGAAVANCTLQHAAN